MEIIQGTTDFQLYRETAVAIGKFDGVHIGHRRLLDEILARKADGLEACVFTFDPPPAAFFGGFHTGALLGGGPEGGAQLGGGSEGGALPGGGSKGGAQLGGESEGGPESGALPGRYRELTTREEKRTIFEHMGVDTLIEFPLNRETAATPPEVFVREILAGRMQAAFIAAGEDLSFGAGGAGDVRLLRSLGGECGFEVKTIAKVCIDGEEVSSTRIRGLVEQCRMEEAEQMLGKPYALQGRVAHGSRIGRTLGFPTVNLLPDEGKILPGNGVYFSRVRCGKEIYRAVSNVGYKPTVAEKQILGVESYLYDFDREIYDEAIEVELLKFRRPERRFESLEALRAQLKEDIAAGERFWNR